MKKLLIVIVATSLFVACKDKAAKTEEKTDKTEKTTTDTKPEPSPTEPTTTTTTTSDDSGAGWSKAQESTFMRDCESTATPKVGAARANEYCDCMLQKIKAKYSTYAQADRELASDEAGMNKLAAECNNQ
jgi:hypothetical protein